MRAKGWQGWRPGPQPPPSYEHLRGFIAERVGMSPDATNRSAAQRADQKGNDLEPNPRPDGFHRADVQRLHEGPGFLQGVTHACRPPRAVQRLRRHQLPAGALLSLQGGQDRCCWPWQGGRTDCRGLQASFRLRGPGWGFWALEIQRLGVAGGLAGALYCRCQPRGRGAWPGVTGRHGDVGLALHQLDWNAVVELLKLRREILSAQIDTNRG